MSISRDRTDDWKICYRQTYLICLELQSKMIYMFTLESAIFYAKQKLADSGLHFPEGRVTADCVLHIARHEHLTAKLRGVLV